MWYSDPFLLFPAIFAHGALLSFVMVLITSNLRLRVARVIASVFAIVFIFVASFSYFFGYFLRHSEEISRWFGAIGG